jgi:hypothetical protein
MRLPGSWRVGRSVHGCPRKSTDLRRHWRAGARTMPLRREGCEWPRSPRARRASRGATAVVAEWTSTVGSEPRRPWQLDRDTALIVAAVFCVRNDALRRLFLLGALTAVVAGATCRLGRGRREFARTAWQHDLRVRPGVQDDRDPDHASGRGADGHDLRLPRLLELRVGLGGRAWPSGLQRRPLEGRRRPRHHESAHERAGRCRGGELARRHGHPLRVPAHQGVAVLLDRGGLRSSRSGGPLGGATDRPSRSSGERSRSQWSRCYAGR